MSTDNSFEALVKRFQGTKCLDSDSQSKKVAYLGTIDGKLAILQAEKTHFDGMPRLYGLKSLASNDVYHWGTTDEAKVNLIYPASEQHVAKYTKHPTHIIAETPEAYKTVVKPYIETQLGDRIQWVRNILYNGTEAERVVFKNDDYIVLPDMKWDGTTIESLYLVSIVYREVSSIRDLTRDDIPWLERIQESLLKEIPAKYGLARDRLRLYVHYQPSFYHFHIHVVNADYSGLGQTILAGKAILLGEVIENLKWSPYSERTITYALSESHKLWDGLKQYTQ